jgi:hypothetical protein
LRQSDKLQIAEISDSWPAYPDFSEKCMVLEQLSKSARTLAHLSDSTNKLPEKCPSEAKQALCQETPQPDAGGALGTTVCFRDANNGHGSCLAALRQKSSSEIVHRDWVLKHGRATSMLMTKRASTAAFHVPSERPCWLMTDSNAGAMLSPSCFLPTGRESR